jgi:hypothetical protein
MYKEQRLNTADQNCLAGKPVMHVEEFATINSHGVTDLFRRRTTQFTKKWHRWHDNSQVFLDPSSTLERGTL